MRLMILAGLLGMISPVQSAPVSGVQTSAFVTIDEKIGDQPPTPGGHLVYTCEMRVVGRKGVVLLDTMARALPYSVEAKAVPTNLLEYAVRGLGRTGWRVVAEPTTGKIAWVNVVTIRRM